MLSSSLSRELTSALAVSIAAIICEYYDVLCASGSYNVHFAEVYLEAIDFVSVRCVRSPGRYDRINPSTSSIALYGLILFYDLTKDELAGRRPLAKLLSIKLIVFFTFYQSFVVNTETPPVRAYHLIVPSVQCTGESRNH